jgi:predicted XRE-type DNA-binding protein
LIEEQGNWKFVIPDPDPESTTLDTASRVYQKDAKDTQARDRSCTEKKKGYSMKLTKNMKSDFDAFLKEDGIYEEVNDVAIKRVIAYQIAQEMKEQKITKTKMAELMHTSRAVVNRLLNPDNGSLTLSTLESATTALGKRLNITIV